MFKSRHDELLDIVKFKPDGPAPAYLRVVDVWKYAGVEECDEKNFRYMSIGEAQLEDWLVQRGEFEQLPGPRGAALEGGIKILFCERTNFRPPGIPMSRASYLRVEEFFNLPPNSLESLFHYDGTFSRHFEYAKGASRQVKSIGQELSSAFQKMPVGNSLLAMSYDPATKITTALIHGSFLHDPLPTMRHSIWQAPLAYDTPRRHRDYAGFQFPEDPDEITQSSQFLERLRGSILQWGNPLLLPVLLLQNYMSRAQIFAWDIDDQIISLERQTGVVFAGRNVHLHERHINPENIPRDKIRQLTQDIHTLLTEIIFFHRVTAWCVDCAAFFSKTSKEITRVSHDPSADAVDSDDRFQREHEMAEVIEFMEVGAKGLCGMQNCSRGRVDSQIGVLYSYIAQIDNSLNAKIAVSSARDSSAMKTLALITTVFLPGTYVATLFSMSMFSWSQPNRDSSATSSSSSTISHDFWIYWAITLPLTGFVMVLWRLWWLWQERKYQKEVDKAAGIGEITEVTEETKEKAIEDFDAEYPCGLADSSIIEDFKITLKVGS